MLSTRRTELKSPSSSCPMCSVQVLQTTPAVKKLLLNHTQLDPQCSQDSLPALHSGTCKALFELIKIIVFPKSAWPRKSKVSRAASFFWSYLYANRC